MRKVGIRAVHISGEARGNALIHLRKNIRRAKETIAAFPTVRQTKQTPCFHLYVGMRVPCHASGPAGPLKAVLATRQGVRVCKPIKHFAGTFALF